MLLFFISGAFSSKFPRTPLLVNTLQWQRTFRALFEPQRSLWEIFCFERDFEEKIISFGELPAN